MTPTLELPLHLLEQRLTDPQPDPPQVRRSVGGLVVFEGAANEPRTQTWLVLPNRWLLLVDVFHAEQVQSFQLRLTSSQRIERKGVAYVMHDGLRIDPLGDYFPRDEQPLAVTFTQRFIQGRFLLAVTRDPEIRFRVLNGWSVEARTPERVDHLLHSNRSRRLRPLGPVRADALYGIASWQLGVGGEVAADDENDATLQLVQASNIEWPGGRTLTLATPADLVYQPARTGNRATLLATAKRM